MAEMWFPKLCVVFCVVSMENVLINVSFKTSVEPLSDMHMKFGFSFRNECRQHILGRTVRTRKKNTKALVVACKEGGLEVNADKTKYVVVS